MRITWIITFVCAAAIVSAQQPVAKSFSSAADVQSMIEKAKNERKSDQPNFIQPILQAAPYSVNLEYRVQGIDTNPNIHDVEAEMFTWLMERESSRSAANSRTNGVRMTKTAPDQSSKAERHGELPRAIT